jgi:hypothetical protein
MIGEKISPILIELESILWEYEANGGLKPEYSIEGFRGATKIFMSVLMDKMWELQQKENIPLQDRINMVEKAGKDVRKLIKTYTDIDCHELYFNKENKNSH